jgi:hypothetical protein
MPIIASRAAGSARGFGFQGGKGPYEVTWLVVAGGCAGSNLSGGAGGAGGYRTSTLILIPGDTYPVVVGAGSNTVGSASKPPNGSPSTFGPFSSSGGGAGGHEGNGSGSPGGSGGGGRDSGGGSGGAGNAGGYSPPEGSGGSPSGDGGGINGTGPGASQANTISGSPVAYSGGGSQRSSSSGGGNQGHGGGGQHWATGGNGGSGRVVIRYAGPQRGEGGNVSTSGGDVIHDFTSTGPSSYVA